MNTIIMSLLFQNTAETLRFIMVDPKRVELTLYNGIPHLLTPVITNTQKTVNALKWTIGEMDRRFEVLAAAGNRDINSYNARHPSSKIPAIIFVIDELADLMATAASEVESGIIRLAQMARAAGIRAARGEIIIQLDADTVIPETFIDAHHMHYSDEYVVGVSAKVATVGVHPLVYAWCLGSKWFRGLLGEHREVLYGIGSNISYRKNAVMKCLIHYEQHMQRAEDRKMLALLRNQGLVVNASGKTIDIQVSGRKYQTLRQAVAFIGASLMRKIVWRYHKWLPENTVLDDVR
jgi:cellulose synthase/poly-beta-1,6-N-acetylglucosamine synthase-like glycosyltransferase